MMLKLVTAKDNSSFSDHACQSDSDCGSPFDLCTQDMCTHKPLFPIISHEFFGAVILCFTILVTNKTRGTIGELLFTVILAFFGFALSQSIAICSVCIAIYCSMKLFRLRSSMMSPQQKLEEDQQFYFMLPSVFLGTFIGYQLFNSLSSSIVFIILTWFLAVWITKIVIRIFKVRNSPLLQASQERSLEPINERQRYLLTQSIEMENVSRSISDNVNLQQAKAKLTQSRLSNLSLSQMNTSWNSMISSKNRQQSSNCSK